MYYILYEGLQIDSNEPVKCATFIVIEYNRNVRYARNREQTLNLYRRGYCR